MAVKNSIPNVLLVEDIPEDAKLVERCLGGEFRMVCVDSLKKAETRLKKGHFEIILLDLTLPDSEGLQTLSKVRKIAPDVPIVVITAAEDREMAVRAVRRGAQDYLFKGAFDALLLQGTLRHGIERQKACVQYLSLLRHNPDGVLLVDPNGLVFFANQAAGAMLRRKIDKIQGRPFDIPLAGEDEALEIDLPRGKTAELRSAEIDWQGRAAFLVMIRDVTERKNAQRELERSNKELERFAYIVSHDLQSPLRGIRTFTEILAEDYKGKLDKDADECINIIIKCTSKAQLLISELLTFSRVQSKEQKFKRFRFEEVLENAVDNLAASIRDTRAKITHDPLPGVVADYGQMVQLVENLVDNAVKFKGKRLPRVHISAKKSNGEWVFSVKDNGIGIQKKDFDKIFEVFQRLHDKEEYSGTGIGLAICKKIMDRHQGRIWVDSEAGKGSVFNFTLPV